ncbi:MAG: helix-turn-helix domain-containing protein [Calothrix sp. FI2-JRJ7]|jgi:DNA-binding transcriptional regulator YiaG|nr:helix-turn-helix domain-containing protein [Calothrix sp. FI2-JRJ7]
MATQKNSAINQPEFGYFLRELRIKVGLTQEQFAAALGVTYTTVNRWENGRSKPSPMAQRLIQKMQQEIETVETNKII